MGIFTLLRWNRYPTVGQSDHLNVWVGYTACSFLMHDAPNSQARAPKQTVDDIEVQTVEA